MTNEEREQEFENIMLSNWTRDELNHLEKLAKATNAYDRMQANSLDTEDDGMGHS